MPFDRGIPPPARLSRWDFEDAQDGDSKGFDDPAEAKKFAAAARAYSRANGLNWKTTAAEYDGKHRVWLLIPTAKAPMHRVSTVQRIEPIARPGIAIPDDAGDDFGIVVDLRNGEGISLQKNPEARPVGEQEEAPDDGTPRRRNKRREG
jgi:hypothetical protein